MASPTDYGATPGSKATAPTAEIVAASLVMASALQLAENLLPKVPVFPWLKLGLSHLILLPFLMRYGALPATALALSRNLLTWLVAGTPLTSVVVGMGAAWVSVGLVGGALRPLARRGWVGWVGMGVASAAAHNLAQLVLVETVLVDHDGFYFQLAPLAVWALLSGTVTALLAAAARPFWNELFDEGLPMPAISRTPDGAQPDSARLFGAWAFAALIMLVWPDLLFQAIAFGLLATYVFIEGLRSRSAPSPKPAFWPSIQRYGWRPVRGTWPLLLFMAWLHLFHHEGHLVGFLGMTREGITEFAVNALRLFNLSLVGPQLLRHFPRGRLMRMSSPFARGLCLALPALAGLPAAVPAASRHLWMTWKKAGAGGWSAGLRQFAAEVLAHERNR